MEGKNEGEKEKVVGGEEGILPGFRFHPTDEELVGFYLKRKIQQRPLSIELIKQLDIYKFDPWDLPKIASGGEKEWYFYCPRDRKYRNSTRPNRVTGAGFWKATGTDRPIYSSEGNKCIGLKKSLVFYKGRAAKGVKTDWMMHEFRLPSLSDSFPSKKSIHNAISPNDSWAICRIFKKTNPTTPRTTSNSWVSPSLPNYNNNNTIKTNNSNNSCDFPMQTNPSNNNNQIMNNILQLPNNFSSFLDHVPIFKPIYPTINEDNIENKPCFDQQYLSIPPLLDLPPSYILPQLEDPCEVSKSSIDISSMLLNVPLSSQGCFSSPSEEFGQCNDDLISSVILSQNTFGNAGGDRDFCPSLDDYQDFPSALMGNLNNLLHGEDEHQYLIDGARTVGSFHPVSGLLPLDMPETWKSSSTSLVWDCAPLS
ncbi:hypothetical protein vseg_019932 [Gypsophila vaccaria]